jgi:hypothetical protein
LCDRRCLDPRPRKIPPNTSLECPEQFHHHPREQKGWRSPNVDPKGPEKSSSEELASAFCVYSLL